MRPDRTAVNQASPGTETLPARMTSSQSESHRSVLRGWVRSASRFLMVSGVSFLTTFGLTVLGHDWLGMTEESSFATAVSVAFVMNFFFLRFFIYGRSEGSLIKQFLAYCVSAAVFRSLEYFGFTMLVKASIMDYRFITVFVLMTSTVLKFLFYRLIFGDRRQVPVDKPDSGLSPE